MWAGRSTACQCFIRPSIRQHRLSPDQQQSRYRKSSCSASRSDDNPEEFAAGSQTRKREGSRTRRRDVEKVVITDTPVEPPTGKPPSSETAKRMVYDEQSQGSDPDIIDLVWSPEFCQIALDLSV